MAQQRLELTWYNKDKALIPTVAGRYGYTWVDPADPRYCETRTLILDDFVTGQQTPKSDDFEYSERADLPPQDDNLLILGESGDVLEALTRVPELAEKYVGKVKLIYIDPPFNTAQTFASYEDNLEHSIWLTMMRDRLLHLKRLLAEDGAIWVHLDDVENHRMRLLLDEVFGNRNFVTEMHWEKTYSPRNDSQGISAVTDVILVYSKSSAFSPIRLPRTTEMDARYSNPDQDPHGAWTMSDPNAPTKGNGRQHPSVFGIQHPITGEMLYPSKGRCWCFSAEKMLEIMRGWGRYEFGENTPEEVANRTRVFAANVEFRDDVRPLVIPGWNKDDKQKAQEVYERGNWPLFMLTQGGLGGFRRKLYLRNMPGRTPTNLLPHIEVGHTDGAKKEIHALFPDVSAFSTPKPERLLERIIHIGSNPGDIVLDVFAGSGTTAAVAQKMGRRWVTCELLETTFNTFTRPRLEKVINDQDPGGITRTKGERVAAPGSELPEGVSPDDAAKFTSVLNKLLADDSDAKKDPRVKALKAAAKTARTKEVINWRGGGGFQVAHLAPACFDYDSALDRVMLTPEATGHTLVASVAANLGFRLLHPDDDYVFDGHRGKTLLKVIEGMVTTEDIDSLLSHLSDGENLLIAATTVMDGVREHLRKNLKGSRIVAIPDDIFRYSQGGEL